jgi:mono/diheme cytochrome c family protein
LKAFLRAFLVFAVMGALIGGLLVYSVVRRGLSARVEPSRMEELLARTTRRLATPSGVRSAANPVEPTAEVLSKAIAHFADHCATCHANDGSGDTAIGRGLYPKAPDMRAMTTQSLTDGELFSIIENGIRLTGMPAWGSGTAESERETWSLVHFIRRLPTLSPESIEKMKTLNPKTPAEFREEEEARRFLAGEDAQPGSATALTMGHTH